jgi:hypothetical protein
MRIARIEDKQFARTNVEQQQPIGGTANVRVGAYQRELHDGQLSYKLMASKAQVTLAPYEDLQVIRTGAMQSADKARLAESVDAAIAWTKDEGVQVFFDRTRAVEQSGDIRAQALFIVREPEYARLRICKLASTPAALPGEQVEFTLRYDNAGDQVLGNIVIRAGKRGRVAGAPLGDRRSPRTGRRRHRPLPLPRAVVSSGQESGDRDQ